MLHTTMKFAPVLSSLIDNVLTESLNNDTLFTRGHYPKINATEHEKAFELEMLVPGIDKADINLSVENQVLTISYKHADQAEKEGKSLFTEFTIRSFERKITLGKQIDTAGISAKYDSGVLYITLPKVSEQQSTASKIEIL